MSVGISYVNVSCLEALSICDSSMLHSNPSAGQRPAELTSREKAYQLRMGERGYKRFENIKREERQRGMQYMPELQTAVAYPVGLSQHK